MPRRWNRFALRASAALIGLVACLPRGPVAAEGAHDTLVPPAQAEQQAAALYGAVSDAIPKADAEKLLHGLVNAERRKAGVAPLEWSDMAEALAQDQAQYIAKQHVGSHYDAAGRKPAQRWNRLGEYEHVEENMVYYEVNRPVALTPQLVRHMLADWLASPSHRANLLDPYHTASGCAFSLAQGEGTSYVAGVQEFVRHYGTFRQLPAEASAGATLDFGGLLNADQVKLAYVGLAHEPLPHPLSAAENADHGWTYDAPPVLKTLQPWQVGYDFHAGSFDTRLRLPAAWSGCLVYVTVWARKLHDPSGRSLPFCVMTQVVEVT
jgi:uncharacterized protein YkwD